MSLLLSSLYSLTCGPHMSSPSFSFPHMPHPPVRPWAPARTIARRSAAALLLLARRRTPLARPPPHPPCSPPCALLLAPRCAPFTGEREAEVREAAAELAVVCAAMKDGGGFGMCCFLRGGGGGENQQSSRPELGIGKQEEPAAASRAGAAARGGEQGARQHASKRSAAADRCASRRSPWGGEPVRSYRQGGTGVRLGGAAPALPTRPRSATRPLIRGASAPWPPGRWRRGVGQRRRGVGGGGRLADARGPGQGLGKIREVIEGERRRKDGGGR